MQQDACLQPAGPQIGHQAGETRHAVMAATPLARIAVEPDQAVDRRIAIQKDIGLAAALGDERDPPGPGRLGDGAYMGQVPDEVAQAGAWLEDRRAIRENLPWSLTQARPAANRTASSAARNSARLFWRVSSYSASGTLSATTPQPA